uniref:Uncharacterized protein n=1 Tax=Oryza meridionalis TaxID=40149 RepID=A0A0E0E1B1_9ORYZ
MCSRLAASKELVEALGPGDGLNPSTTSLLSALRAKLDLARAHARQLTKEGRRRGDETARMRAQLAEEAREWRSRQREKVVATVRVAVAEVEAARREGERQAREGVGRRGEGAGEGEEVEGAGEGKEVEGVAGEGVPRARQGRPHRRRGRRQGRRGGGGGDEAGGREGAEELEKEREMLRLTDELRWPSRAPPLRPSHPLPLPPPRRDWRATSVRAAMDCGEQLR